MDFFKNFDKNIHRYGISKSSRILVDGLGLKPSINLKKFPKKGGVLVYSNHPTGLDPFLLASVLERDDFLFLGDIYHTKKGKNVTKYIAPTMSTQNILIEFLKRRPTNWPGFIKMRLTTKFDHKKAKEFNAKAIQKIISNVAKGHLSLVFPSGGEYEFLSWKKGIYKIVKELYQKKIKFILYKIDIKKFSEFKLILHFISFRRLFGNLLIEGHKTSTIIK